MHVILLILAGIVLWPVMHGAIGTIKDKVICRNCGSISKPVVISVSHFMVEIMLWCAGLLPGVLYTLWCRHTAFQACGKCGSREIVPLDSPVGRTLAAKHAADITPLAGEP